MKVWNGISAIPGGRPRMVASIGNYDGLHVGHQTILDGVVGDARQRSLETLVITFEPHPLAVVAPDRCPQLLQTRRQKMDLLERTGLTHMLVVHFTEQVAALTGEAFMQMLTPHLDLAAVHVGENFRFGRRRDGDLALLRRIGAEQGFDVTGVRPVVIEGQTVSSSAIRTSVAEGDVERARRFLDRPFELTGRVVPGDGRGRGLGFPTANVDVENQIVPKSGVYVTETVALAARHPSLTNVGIRPTFGGQIVCVETHLLEFSDDLYGERLAVRFLGRVRDEQRFETPTDLADQIARDRAAAEAYFANTQLRFS